MAEGLSELAPLYEPGRANSILESVQRLSKSRKCLYVLIRAESVLVTTLIDLAGLGNLPIKQQARRMASFEKKWRYQLRRMYPGNGLHLAGWPRAAWKHGHRQPLARNRAQLLKTDEEDYSTKPKPCSIAAGSPSFSKVPTSTVAFWRPRTSATP